MSIHVPPKDWFKAPKGAERMWIGIALVWCIVLFTYLILFSSREFKKCRLRYFLPELDTWWENHRA